MDLNLVMEQLRPGENVSPDMSSYNTMVIYWRGSGSPPSLQEVNDKWAEIEPKFNEEKVEEAIKEELDEAGADVKAMVDALWEKIMDGVSKKADDLKIIVDQIK